MNRLRTRLPGWSFLGLLLLAFAAQAADPARPNFIVLIGEGQGWSSLSAPMDDRIAESRSLLVRTPNLDRIAREGMRFTRFHAASPRCTPTRAALLTGRSPAALRMTFVSEGGGDGDAKGGLRTRLLPAESTTELPRSVTTLAELLKTSGYRTAHFGKWHLGRTDPAAHGFDESTGPTSNGGPDNVSNPNPKQAFRSADLGVDFITRAVREHRPFYLQIAQYAGRSALDVLPETLERVRARAAGRNPVETAAAAVAEDADNSYGRILATLESLGVLESTFVIYTTDHGAPGRNPPFSGGKGMVSEGGLRVPLLIRGPGVSAGTFARTFTTSVDLFPTVAELAGVDPGSREGLEGGSLVPLLRAGGSGEVRRAREDWLVHVPHYDKDPLGPASALIHGDLKLVRIYETGERRLHDLATDPSERVNLARDRPEVVDDLDRRLTEALASAKAALPRVNGNADPKASADTLPGERRGLREGRPGRNDRRKAKEERP